MITRHWEAILGVRYGQIWRDFQSAHNASRLGRPPHAYDGSHKIGWIHVEKLSSQLRVELIRSGLANDAGPSWIVIAPDLAVVNTAAPAERVAVSNDPAVVTDHEKAHGILNGWNIEKLTAEFRAPSTAPLAGSLVNSWIATFSRRCWRSHQSVNRGEDLLRVPSAGCLYGSLSGSQAPGALMPKSPAPTVTASTTASTAARASPRRQTSDQVQ